ncbi:MAG: hypothetical protein ABIP53_00380 [Candidatus Limnocylindrales bacterium]
MAILTHIWGRSVIKAGVHAMNLAPINPDGTATAELLAATRRVKLLVSLELIVPRHPHLHDSYALRPVASETTRRPEARRNALFICHMALLVP